MEHQFQIGDEFKINHSEIYKVMRTSNRYKCKDPDKTFIVSKLSHSRSSVYYIDGRTSRKCLCRQCDDKKIEKCIGISDIILVSPKIQREREIQLKKLFGKY